MLYNKSHQNSFKKAFLIVIFENAKRNVVMMLQNFFKLFFNISSMVD